MSKLLVIFLPLLAPSVVTAFSWGAGRCEVGVPSPKNYHPTPDLSGPLEVGGFTISLDGERVSHTETVTVTAGTEFELVVNGPGHKGVLIIVAGEPDTSIIPGAELKYAETSWGCRGNAAVTQTGRDWKLTSSAVAVISEPKQTTIDINIVVSHSSPSIYYYSQITVNAVEGPDEAVALSDAPSMVPSDVPSSMPSDAPSSIPSDMPSVVPIF